MSNNAQPPFLSNEELLRICPRMVEDDFQNTSDPTCEYNCIAWAIGATDLWWEPFVAPGYFWPNGVDPDYQVQTLVRIFSLREFVECGRDSSLEPGFEKIAIYAEQDEGMHVARQLPNGTWTSKLGMNQDIMHKTAECIAGGDYEALYVVMKRGILNDPHQEGKIE